MRWWPGRRQERRESWDGIDFLDVVPRPLVAAEVGDGGVDSEHAGDRVVLLVPRYRDPVWGRLIQPRLGPRKRFVRVPLEARGSALWRAMDGRSPLRDLLPAVAAADAGDPDGLPKRICLYAQALADNGFIALERPRGTRGGSGDT